MNRTVSTLLLCFSMMCMGQEAPQQLMQQALEAQQAGRFEEAVHDYRTLVNQFPNIFEIRSNLGAALAGEGQYTEAIIEYEKALSIRANPAVRLNLALAYYKSGELLKAADTLKQVHDEEPANMQATELLADCYLQLGQNQNAITLLTPIWNGHPDDDAITYLLSTALVRDGQSAQGEKIIDRILRNSDSAEAMLLMGTAKYMTADYPGAKADLEKAIQLDPHLPDVYSYYGRTLFDSGDHLASQKAFEQALQLDPNDFISNLDMGILLRGSEKYEDALQYLRRALELRPGDPNVRYEVCMIEMLQGQLAEAARDLESLVKDKPDFRQAVWQLATVYTRMGRKADAERERAIYMKLNSTPEADASVHVEEGLAVR
jgi:tetratricopeptide (TPR) repeat protein